MEIKVTKLTDVGSLRKAASATTGKPCSMSLKTAYANRHSLIRTQWFRIEMIDIPLFCASQFNRSHVGVNWFQGTKRTDRGGTDFIATCNELARRLQSEPSPQEMRQIIGEISQLPNRFDRYAPTTLLGEMNAEAVMNMSAKRLCAMASNETRQIWSAVIEQIYDIDPDLAAHCVRPCVSAGLCRESHPCGFMKTAVYKSQRQQYLSLFKESINQ